MLRTVTLCGVLLIGLLTSLTISQTGIVSAGTNVWASNSMICPSAITLSSGSCLSERRDRAYGGKLGFPLGSFSQQAASNCTIAWTRMLDDEPTPGGLVPVLAVRAGKFHTAHKLTREATPAEPASRHGTTAHPDPWSGHYPEMARRGAGPASSPTRATGTGTVSPPSMGLC